MFVYLYIIKHKDMTTIIQHSALNPKKNNRLQHFLKEVSDLNFYKQLQKDGIIFNLEVISL